MRREERLISQTADLHRLKLPLNHHVQQGRSVQDERLMKTGYCLCSTSIERNWKPFRASSWLLRTEGLRFGTIRFGSDEPIKEVRWMDGRRLIGALPFSSRGGSGDSFSKPCLLLLVITALLDELPPRVNAEGRPSVSTCPCQTMNLR